MLCIVNIMTPTPGSLVVWLDDRHGLRKSMVISSTSYFDGPSRCHELTVIECKHITSWLLWEVDRDVTWRTYDT